MSQSSLHLSISAFWRSILFGEGLQLKGIEGILSAAHILHGVLSPAALTADNAKFIGYTIVTFTPAENKDNRIIFVHKSEVTDTDQISQVIY